MAAMAAPAISNIQPGVERNPSEPKHGTRTARRWPRRVAGGALAILAVTGPSTLVWAAEPSGPVVPALVALDPQGLGAGAGFGTSVAAAGATLVVGAPLLGGGLAYVYIREAGAWRETAELRGPGTQPGDFFGGAVATTGTTVVVGADDHDGTGAAYVFRKDGSGWHQDAELAGSGDRPGSGFGYSVAIGAGTIVVGAPMPVLGTGTAYVFTQDRRGWHQVAELRAKDAPADGFFGFSVAASGRDAVVGDPGDVRGTGRAYVFSAAPDGWRQTAELAGRDTQAGDNFGFSVAESAGQVLIGAPWHRSGAVYAFCASVRGWRQSAEVTGRGAQPGDKFGWSVAMGPGLAAVGAPGDNTGRAYLFSQARQGWRQSAELAGPSTPGSYFGTSSAVTGAEVVIGANGYHAGTGAAWASTLSREPL
jgi:FG-GAP repeat